VPTRGHWLWQSRADGSREFLGNDSVWRGGGFVPSESRGWRIGDGEVCPRRRRGAGAEGGRRGARGGWPQPRCGWLRAWTGTQGRPRAPANPSLGWRPERHWRLAPSPSPWQADFPLPRGFAASREPPSKTWGRGQWGQICPFDKSLSGPKARRIDRPGQWYRVVTLARSPLLELSGYWAKEPGRGAGVGDAASAQGDPAVLEAGAGQLR